MEKYIGNKWVKNKPNEDGVYGICIWIWSGK